MWSKLWLLPCLSLPGVVEQLQALLPLLFLLQEKNGFSQTFCDFSQETRLHSLGSHSPALH